MCRVSNQLTARRVYDHRTAHGPFTSREQLKEVTGFGEASFVQAAGFLRIVDAQNPLDATWIHPESYEVALRVLEKLGYAPEDLNKKEGLAELAQKAAALDLDPLAAEFHVGPLLLKDIIAQLTRPGRDPREDLPAPLFKRGILKLEDLASGMELHGAIVNVVDFGAFVDIGLHDSGLVHVSQMSNRFVRDPHELVAVGDIVKVWVLEIDKERRRVSLTMTAPGSRREGVPSKPSETGEEQKDRPRGKRPPRQRPPFKPPQGDSTIAGAAPRPPAIPQHNRSPAPQRPAGSPMAALVDRRAVRSRRVVPAAAIVLSRATDRRDRSREVARHSSRAANASTVPRSRNIGLSQNRRR